MHNTPDKILYKKILQGNKLAFDNLFFKYYKPLFRFALHYCKNITIAEESVQNTFIKLWNKKANPDNKSEDLANLLFTYTKNNIIDEFRKANLRIKHEQTAIINSINEENKIEENKNKIKAIIEAAIEQLPKKSREIFRLAKQEGLSINEIAEHRQISKKTVENQITIAYKKMRKYLEPYKNQLYN
ncbi:MAG: sigma-70 family RNA polymerase sigma factor [Bacteroidota bacterium]|nr:sigma-70 family RNA polymerase sigma factor [Bacteroidota bacterium]